MIPTAATAVPSEAATAAENAGLPADPGLAADGTDTMMPAADNDLLSSLISAMREVADHERETSLAGLRGSVDEAIETMRQRAEVGADELRRKADGDITGIGDWVKVEVQRVSAEGDRKIEARRQQLTQQLTDHEQRSQHEIESLHARFDEYERELASFFAQLHEIDDPAAFGAAAKRMPRPPTLTGQAASTPVVTGMPTEAPEATSEEAKEPVPSVSVAAPVVAEQPVAPTAQAPDQQPVAPAAQAPDEAEAQMVEEHRTRLDALGLGRPESPNGTTKPADESSSSADEPMPTAAESTAAESTAAEASADHNPLRARLAELDAAIGPEEIDEPSTSTQGRGGEVATAIVVHGLGSFGAITSFKQALERVDGVHGISLALGPTGEFVYRATHDTDFDLVAAIGEIERGGAQIDRQADGSLRVTVQRTR